MIGDVDVEECASVMPEDDEQAIGEHGDEKEVMHPRPAARFGHQPLDRLEEVDVQAGQIVDSGTPRTLADKGD